MTDLLPPAPPPPGQESIDERFEAISQDLQRFRLSRDSWTMFALGFGVLAALISIVGIGLALRNDGGESGAPAVVPVQATLTEFAINLSSGQLAEGGVIQVTNAGTMIHDLTVTGTDLNTGELQPGESATLDVSELPAGVYELYCTLPGHAGSGMVTTLVIGSGAADGGAAASHDHATMTDEEAAAMDAAMMETMAAFPAETEGVGNVPLEPEVLADGTFHYELTAAITPWEVAPGEVVQAWTYNGMVPGPRIDAQVGDTLEFEITNGLPVGTDVHWHGIDVPNDQDGVAPITQEIVAPGESFTYRFTVTEPAIGMYHAHAHGDVALPNGMFGTFYVGTAEEMVAPLLGTTISGIEIPDEVEIAQDIPMVVNDAGVIGLTLNGKSFPATEPYVVDKGDWIRITYYNEGLQVHPMHLHGFEQLVIAKDGEPLDAPYAADTILVGPGERYTVLVNPDLEGVWVWHCHILNHVESADGMFGMVTALIVQ